MTYGRRYGLIGRNGIGKTTLLRMLAQRALRIAAHISVLHVEQEVVGDDTLFPWEPFPSDWSIDDMVWGFGAPVSALSINDNQIRVMVIPGVLPKATSVRGAEGPTRAVVKVDPPLPYYTVEADVQTVPKKSKWGVEMERAPGSRVLRIYGTIAEGAAEAQEIAIADPEGGLERGQHPARDAVRLAVVLERVDQDREFVTAEPGSRVGRPEHGPEPQRDRAQQLIAQLMAEAVVDRLEVVEVEEQHGEQPIRPIRDRQRLGEAVLEQRPVGEPRERIVRGEVHEGVVSTHPHRSGVARSEREGRARHGGLMVEQPPLAVEAACIAGQ